MHASLKLRHNCDAYTDVQTERNLITKLSKVIIQNLARIFHSRHIPQDC